MFSWRFGCTRENLREDQFYLLLSKKPGCWKILNFLCELLFRCDIYGSKLYETNLQSYKKYLLLPFCVLFKQSASYTVLFTPRNLTAIYYFVFNFFLFVMYVTLYMLLCIFTVYNYVIALYWILIQFASSTNCWFFREETCYVIILVLSLFIRRYIKCSACWKRSLDKKKN